MIGYTHLPAAEEVGPVGGACLIAEEILKYKGEDVLYVISQAAEFITFCDGSYIRGIGSIFVKGRIVEWKTKNREGELVSQLEAIINKEEKQEIKEILKAKHTISDIYF